VELLLSCPATAGLGAEAATLGSVDIFVGSGRGVDPYFHPPPPDVRSLC
jgi:hypothetical protein